MSKMGAWRMMFGATRQLECYFAVRRVRPLIPTPSARMVKIISWNIAGRQTPWNTLLAMNADVALLQEAAPPALKLPARVEIDPSPWHTAGAVLNWPWK